MSLESYTNTLIEGEAISLSPGRKDNGKDSKALEFTKVWVIRDLYYLWRFG